MELNPTNAMMAEGLQLRVSTKTKMTLWGDQGGNTGRAAEKWERNKVWQNCIVLSRNTARELGSPLGT